MNRRENCKGCLGFYSNMIKESLKMYSEELDAVYDYEKLMQCLNRIKRFLVDLNDSVGDCEMITFLKRKVESSKKASEVRWSCVDRNMYAQETADDLKIVIDAMIKSIDIT